MLKNYLKIATRTLIRNKAFTSINVLGLTVSLTICLLIFKILVSIYSSDSFHSDKNRTYRVTSKLLKAPFQNKVFATSSSSLYYEFQSFSGVEDAVRLWNKFYDFGKSRNNPLPISGYFADENFFTFFDFELKYGDPESVLQDPYSIVLSHEMSLKLFPGENPLGKSISFKDYGDFTVTGVIEEQKYKSHMTFEVIASGITLSSIPGFNIWYEKSNELDNSNYTHTYIKIDPASSPPSVIHQLNELLKSSKGNDVGLEYQLQALTDISPGPMLWNSLGSVDEKPILLSIIAFLLILMTGFTYNNLSVAKSISRAKEVGVRKIHGANKKQLFIQFILEAVIISLISLVFAKFLLDLFMPFILSLDQGIAGMLEYSTNPMIYLYFIAFAIILGLITGAFPAWYISKFQPLSIVKGVKKVNHQSKFGLKRSIIIFQFFLSFMLLFSVIVLFKQFNHQAEIDLGFNPQNIINIDLQGSNFQILANEISAHSGVKAVSASSLIPATGRSATKTVFYHNDSPDSLILGFMHVSPEYLNNMEIGLLAGSYFSSTAHGSDKGVIINKTLLEQLAYANPIDAIGNSIGFGKQDPRTIIGVVDDFVIFDLAVPVEPVVIAVDVQNPKFAVIRLKENINQASFITFLEKSWKGLEPFKALTHSYHTGDIEDYHSYSTSIMKFLCIITGFIILIAVLGLLGMVMYDAGSRTKEIGLRKAMGANVPIVLWTLAKGYFWMVLIASIIATPLSWIMNQQILQNFNHRVSLNPFWFLMGIAFMVIIGALTTFSQTYKTANQNPVNTLRYE